MFQLRKTVSATLLVPCLACLAVPARAQTRALLVSMAGTGDVRSGHFQTLQPVDLLRFEPALSLEVFPFLARQNLEVLVGDADRDGEFDDAPTNVDALTWRPTAGRPAAQELILSFSSASTRFLGGTVRDGDLIQLQPAGGFKVVASEATLSSVTGTRTIDVDAAALLTTGELVFSFADNESTTNQTLIQQNGGSATLEDETILGWMPGTTQVRIAYTKAAVLGMVSKAVGRAVTTVVDVVGLSPDSVNPGELWFTVASRSSGLAGAVFTTAGGGTYAVVNNVTLDGTLDWGLKTTPTLDALTSVRAGKDPLALEVVGERVVMPGPGVVGVQVHGAAPGGTVQLFLSHATRPVPVPFPLGSPLNGVRLGYLTLGDPLFYASRLNPALRVAIDGESRGATSLRAGGLPPGLSFILQGVDLSTFEVSEPVAIDLVSG